MEKPILLISDTESDDCDKIFSKCPFEVHQVKPFKEFEDIAIISSDSETELRSHTIQAYSPPVIEASESGNVLPKKDTQISLGQFTFTGSNMYSIQHERINTV